MKKSKLFKTISFSSLALLMGIAGTMAFAPLGASPSMASASELETTTEQGIITPKADDPVIYTTESGLEIKWGNAPNSNLSGFGYFSTTSGSTTYDWILLGISSSFSKLFPIQNTNKSNLNGYYEKTTPAGADILKNNQTPYMIGLFGNTQCVTTIKTNPEIPTDCALILANENVATGVYNDSHSYSGSGTSRHGSYIANIAITNAMEGYYSNKSFGLSAVYSQIQPVDIVTSAYFWNGSSWGRRTTTVNAQHIYPLGAYSSSTTFYWGTYLTAAQIKLTATQWLRGNIATGSNYTASQIDTTGTVADASATGTSGYRPAFVLKIT